MQVLNDNEEDPGNGLKLPDEKDIWDGDIEKDCVACKKKQK